MNDWSEDTQLVVQSVAIIAVASVVMVRAFRIGSLFSGSIGLHFNLMLLYGLGPLSYTLSQFPLPERRPRFDLIVQMADTGCYILAGYTLWCLVELIWPHRNKQSYLSEAASFTPPQIAGMVVAGLFGYFLTNSEIATSGIGTVIPVARGLLFPTVVVAMLRVRPGDPASVIFAILFCGLTMVLSVLSPWRSELVALVFSVFLVVTARARRWSPLVPVIGASLLLVVIPFVDVKKTEPERLREDPTGVLLEVMRQPLEMKTEKAMEFFSIRTNGLRELAYVNDGLSRGLITHRGGETYTEAVVQLVPRVLWSDKPSFNQTSNAKLPRQIGLLGWEDEVTSWGVHMFAEFGWNFPHWLLVGFVPLMFGIARGMDVVCARAFYTLSGRLLASLVLFFQMLFIVGLVNATTFFLWGLLLVKVFDLQVWGAGTPQRA